MEAVVMKSTVNNNNNNYWIGNPKNNFVTNRTLFPFPSDDLSYLAGGGFLSTPPSSLYHSYQSVFRPPVNFHHFRQQPPVLPIPISVPLNPHNINIARSHSTPNNNLKSSPPRINKSIKNRVRDRSLTPKKSKNQKKDSKKSVPDLVPAATTEEKLSTEPSIDQVTVPDLDLQKEIDINKSCEDAVCVDVDKFSGSAVFTPSPPPSSLPLPTFFLRSKVSCKAEVSGVDVGATDGLRRLLRI